METREGVREQVASMVERLEVLEFYCSEEDQDRIETALVHLRMVNKAAERGGGNDNCNRVSPSISTGASHYGY